MGQLLTDALVIKEERLSGKNTARRVGEWMEDAATAIEAPPTGVQTISSPEGDIIIDMSDPSSPVLLSELAGDPRVRILSCAIRNLNGVWSFIDGVGNSPLRFASISQPGSGRVRIHYDKAYQKAITLLVVPNRDYAVRGITAGASPELDGATIELFQNRTIKSFIRYSTTSWDQQGDAQGISYDSENGLITFTHLTQDAAQITGCSLTPAHPSAYNYQLGVSAPAFQQVFVYNHDGTRYIGPPNNGMRFYFTKTASGLLNDTSIPGTSLWVIALMLDQ